MNAVGMLASVLLSICGVGYGLYVLRTDRSSVIGSLLLGIGVSILAAFFQQWMNELYHRNAFSIATFFIFPGVVYCLPFLRLLRRKLKYKEIIVPFLMGIPVVTFCGLAVGFLVACALGDCL
jgi:hypothetical protein